MSEPSAARIPWPVFAVTVTGAFMVALDLSIVNVAFPSIGRSFPEATPATLSWVLTAYSVVFGALLQLVWVGWLWHWKQLPGGGDYPP